MVVKDAGAVFAQRTFRGLDASEKAEVAAAVPGRRGIASGYEEGSAAVVPAATDTAAATHTATASAAAAAAVVGVSGVTDAAAGADATGSG